MTRIEGTPSGKIDCKRLYVEGVSIFSSCPKCGVEQEKDLGENYFSYPCSGKPEGFWFICEEGWDTDVETCNTEWTVEAIMEISVRLADED